MAYPRVNTGYSYMGLNDDDSAADSPASPSPLEPPASKPLPSLTSTDNDEPADTPAAPPRAPKTSPLDPDSAYTAWTKSPTPQTLSAILDSLSDDMDRAILSAGGQPSPLTRGMARRIGVHAIHSYKPTEGTKFRSWATTQFQRLNREIKGSKTVTKVPESRAYDAIMIRNAIADIEAETGYEPSDAVLSAKLGLPIDRIASIRKSSTPEVVKNDIGTADDDGTAREPIVMDMVYHSISPIDQIIFEYTYGYNNVPKLQATEIAKKLKITPSAVSQRLTKIKALIEEAHGLV